MWRLVVLIMQALVAGGCVPGAKEHEPRPATDRAPSPITGQPEPASTQHGSCPLPASKTNIAVQEVDRGAALIFTTSDDIANLRTRAADLTTVNTSPSTDVHLDNVDGGVRVIFQTRAPANVPVLRREVSERGQALAEKCGLTWTVLSPGTEPKPKKERPAEEIVSPPAPPPAPVEQSSKPKQDAPPKTAPEPDKPKSDAVKPKEEEKPKEGAVLKDQEKPKDEEKPKDGDKPKDADKPKDGDKP